MKILFVENDSRSLIFAEVMRYNGYEVVSADNLKDALRELDYGKYDAVVLDLGEPGINLSKEYYDDILKGYYAGSIFHDKIMRNKFPFLAKNTVFLTGVSNVKEYTRIEWYNEYSSQIVYKIAIDYKDRVFDVLDSFQKVSS